ncbi:16S rRNA (cytosine(1402)-N(4))-methyltransferase RsmH [Lacipirellula sp.]|uniref:16S rRNA (cytosine(1402)-N(4))-methyltransferase RsmH n=1 Tax=Lacipirellula sp. TaxID=2691419 RepID=UPI003D0AE4F2
MNDATVHIPVLFDEVLEQLRPAAGGVFVDGTLGGGGHTRALAERVGDTGRVISVDLDAVAVERASEMLAGLSVSVANASYADIPEVLDEIGVAAVDGVLLDLGLSSDQLADPNRGFSYMADGDLDMRFDADNGEPAWKMIARMSEEHLADVIYQYGEERFSRRIARKIVEQRRTDPVKTAAQLAELVRSCVPRSRGHNIDPATRTFQALRIAVNGELDALQSALRRLPNYLKPGGRLAIISFHSLEDRIVKEAFREDDRLNAVTRKPIVASEEESSRNPRARSAKLRVAERTSV